MHVFQVVIHYLIFYGVWCSCVVAGSQNRIWLGVPLVAIYLVAHLFFMSVSPKKEMVLIVALTVLGCVTESLLSILGAVSYAWAYIGGIAWWTVSLWVCFATTYWHALSWLSSHTVLSAFMGAIGAPLCYAWGESRGAVLFPNGRIEAFFIISIVWAVVFPVSFVISRLVQHLPEDI